MKADRVQQPRPLVECSSPGHAGVGEGAHQLPAVLLAVLPDSVQLGFEAGTAFGLFVSADTNVGDGLHGWLSLSGGVWQLPYPSPPSRVWQLPYWYRLNAAGQLRSSGRRQPLPPMRNLRVWGLLDNRGLCVTVHPISSTAPTARWKAGRAAGGQLAIPLAVPVVGAVATA